ncbi:MAG: hypothetical protein AAF748_12575 [Pseudomonadota bacterium]
MTRNARFITVCCAALVAAWLLSGERLLDAAFEMVDLGPVDDTLIAGVVVLEDWKAGFSLPDAFGELRTAIHAALGL